MPKEKTRHRRVPCGGIGAVSRRHPRERIKGRVGPDRPVPERQKAGVRRRLSPLLGTSVLFDETLLSVNP